MIPTVYGLPMEEVAAYAEARDLFFGTITAHSLVNFVDAYQRLSLSEGFNDQLKEWEREAEKERARIKAVKAKAALGRADREYKEAARLLKKLEGENT